MIKTVFDLRREIDSSYEKYDASQLFTDPYFKDLLYSIVTGACSKLGRMPVLNLRGDINSDITALTTGSIIYSNTLSPLIRNLNSNWEKYVGNVGQIVHECGHVLFTNFNYQGLMKKYWIEENSFYPENPEVKDVKKVLDILSKRPNLKNYYAFLMKNVENILEDCYIENRLSLIFDGVAIQGLELLNNEVYEFNKNISNILKDIASGKREKFELVFSLLLLKYKCGKGYILEGQTKEEDEILKEVLDTLNLCEREFNNLLWEQDGELRCKYFNMVYVKLFRLIDIRDELENNGSGNKDTSENREDISKDDLKNMLDALRNLIDNLGGSNEASGNTDGIKQDISSIDIKEAKNKINVSKDNLGDDAGNRELKSAIKKALEIKMLDDYENEHEMNLKKEVKELPKNIKIPNGIMFRKYELVRPAINICQDIKKYEEIFKDVRKSSMNLSQKINNILKERDTDSMANGFLMGQRFNAKDLVNRDGKYFSREIIPDGKPKTVFSLLIDESGSMLSNLNFEKARRVAILFDDTLTRLSIPHQIVGHSTKNGGLDVFLNCYQDFDTLDGKDKYRLVNVSAHGGNIDGAAITYMGEKLLKRSEEKKVLIVISDGLPAGASFYDKDNVIDTILAIKTYRKKGINIYGACIAHYENISKLYGEGFSFDANELNILEKEFIRIIKKYLVM